MIAVYMYIIRAYLNTNNEIMYNEKSHKWVNILHTRDV